ncbi:MAG: hypothetical protein HYX69_16965 [Planctomycetia bacterium]|nr:hypothetical protein [Planctomycetia bacterium]
MPTPPRRRWFQFGLGVSVAIGIQACAALVMAVVPFGFDIPSSLGLDFGHFLLVAAIYLLALAYGTIASIATRQWGALLAQYLILLIAIALGIIVSLADSSPQGAIEPAAQKEVRPLSPADQQQ